MKKKGCFECLYTAESGELTNNRSQKNDETDMESSIIRNGCGGTRAAYGTATILRTTGCIDGDDWKNTRRRTYGKHFVGCFIQMV